ncbi:hypothetical protein ACFSQW_06065 [Sphingobacterium tabacisoli]|uniref:Uncharacterized protein n=1 Tax=Sphingobacterium tabacisoli TaxID=2044855 RepID=A0ABW5L241_9SPHI
MVSIKIDNKGNVLDKQPILTVVPVDGCVFGPVDGSLETVFPKGLIDLKKIKNKISMLFLCIVRK